MHQAYAIRPIGEKLLFNEGGFWDQSFAITNKGVRQFATEFYPVAGKFRANYFYQDLISRGLLNCTYGPPLKNLPFLEDTKALHDSIGHFLDSFVAAYYTSREMLETDDEVQSWVQEVANEALVLDFPTGPLTSRTSLKEILTQISFLIGVSHHVLNSGEPVATSGLLPLHPSALYAPVPNHKGIKSIMPYLPPMDESIGQIALLARFNRPFLQEQNRTLPFMFSSEEFMNRGSPEVKEAVIRFEDRMQAISRDINQRTFDADGLSQGMPFIWQALDPNRNPYFLSV